MIRWPKRFEGGRVIQENVNLCDLFATLCNLADIATPEGLDSRSLVPLLKDEATNWNNETISQFGPHNVMIKRDNLKYQYYGSEMPEVLFDLEKNPDETIDYIGDPTYSANIDAFRLQLSELGHGPNADTNYKNAGYCESSV